MAAPSLAPLQPEQVAHGAEVSIQAQIPGIGSFVTIAEAYELDYDEDQNIMAVPTLGSRINGSRQGRFKVAGSLKVYWVNQMARALLSGVSPPTAAGASNVSLYHSQRPFQRFNLVLKSTNASSPAPLTIINAVFEKESAKWGEAVLTEETITFVAEDVQGF